MERTYGSNVLVRIEDQTLTIVVDLSQKAGTSKSGKSAIIASTGGNVVLPGGARLGVNVYIPQ